MNKKTFQIRYVFPSKFQPELSRTVSPTRALQVDVRSNFVREEPQNLQCFAHDLGYLCRGRRIHISGHSDFAIFQHYGRILQILLECTRILHQSAACSSQSGYLGITSIAFAAVIWDADEPCSVKAAKVPESSFNNVTSEHDSTFPFLVLWI